MPTILPDTHRAAIIQAISNAAAPLHALYGATIQSDGEPFKADFTGIANDLEHALELLGVKPDEVRTVTLPHD